MRVVLQEGRDGAAAGEAERRFDVVQALLERGYSVTCAGDSGAVAPLDRDEILVLGDGVEGEITAVGAPGGGPRVRARDIRDLDTVAVTALVDEACEATGAHRSGDWKPWFPVIDFDRCTNCMQCLSFCLFDVYGVDAEQRIRVANSDKCKTNCPACSRVCPEVAILFPKYGQGPINGAEIQQEDVEREKMKIDVSALLGGDIYSLLRQRHARAESRFSRERDSDKALKERQRCLKKLASQMEEIPPEVLMALPSPDEIRRKAAESAARAREALERRAEIEAGGMKERPDSVATGETPD